jgi:hypothetical protein
MFEVDDYVGSPNSNLKFFSGDNLPRVLKQYCEDFEGQALQLNAVASPPELAGLEVSFKKPKGHVVFWSIRMVLAPAHAAAAVSAS